MWSDRMFGGWLGCHEVELAGYVLRYECSPACSFLEKLGTRDCCRKHDDLARYSAVTCIDCTGNTWPHDAPGSFPPLTIRRFLSLRDRAQDWAEQDATWSVHVVRRANAIDACSALDRWATTMGPSAHKPGVEELRRTSCTQGIDVLHYLSHTSNEI
jgi:hypothetical protein